MTQQPAPQPTSAAFAEPTRMPTKGWVLALTLVNLAIMSGWFGPIQVLLAEQAREIAPEHKEALLSFVLGAGALVSTICNPVWGAFSDRTRSRHGRRVPWMVGGLIGGVASLLLLSQATNAVVMVIGWCGVQATLNMMFAAVTASVPDQVPVDRRGLVGGLLNIAQTIGVVVGVGLAGATGSIALGYAATAAWLVLLTLPFVFVARDPALPASYQPPKLTVAGFAASFWVSPRDYPDFAWAWVTRFLLNLGNNIGTMYLLYYVTDALGVAEKEAGGRVLILTAVYAGATILTAASSGWWSDRIGRRRSFVIASGVVMAVAAVMLGFVQTWSSAIAAAVILGLGYGIYAAVDFALITQVLPEAAARGKDMGVINIAAALPQVLAPVIAGGILILIRASGGSVVTNGESLSTGYATVFMVSMACSLLGALLVRRIRGVA